MRNTLTKRNSTKTERIFAEILKELGVPFRHRIIIKNREIDFYIELHGKNICIEIDGHEQDYEKNQILLEAGYIPIHFTNQEIIKDTLNIKTYVNQLIRQGKQGSR